MYKNNLKSQNHNMHKNNLKTVKISIYIKTMSKTATITMMVIYLNQIYTTTHHEIYPWLKEKDQGSLFEQQSTLIF